MTPVWGFRPQLRGGDPVLGPQPAAGPLALRPTTRGPRAPFPSMPRGAAAISRPALSPGQPRVARGGACAVARRKPLAVGVAGSAAGRDPDAGPWSSRSTCGRCSGSGWRWWTSTSARPAAAAPPTPRPAGNHGGAGLGRGIAPCPGARWVMARATGHAGKSCQGAKSDGCPRSVVPGQGRQGCPCPSPSPQHRRAPAWGRRVLVPWSCAGPMGARSPPHWGWWQLLPSPPLCEESPPLGAWEPWPQISGHAEPWLPLLSLELRPPLCCSRHPGTIPVLTFHPCCAWKTNKRAAILNRGATEPFAGRLQGV